MAMAPPPSDAESHAVAAPFRIGIAGGSDPRGASSDGDSIRRRRDGSHGGNDEGRNENRGGGDDDDDGSEPIQLPHSTHSLLFTEPVLSPPFLFAAAIMATSLSCLILALTNGLLTTTVPVSVMWAVSVAQYLSILAVLLMEEEIPTGFCLLRMIPRQSLREAFPHMKYRKFVASSLLRILNGYIFLANALYVILQANEVIEIFYDVLALQFVQQLDDIAFTLARKDVLGKAMHRACTAKCFRAKFHRKKTAKTRSMSIFLKALYFFNLFFMIGIMSYVYHNQRMCKYHDRLITVDFGDAVWDEAQVTVPSWLQSDVQAGAPGEVEPWLLVYAFFNGVYEIEGPAKDGRPVYKERRKFNQKPFRDTIPAEIRYCDAISAWVFAHELIAKSANATEGDCNWLLRSPETQEFDLLKVEGDWQVWVGVIEKTGVSITSNKCVSNSDCNLNGQCVAERGTTRANHPQCKCDKGGGTHFLGSHCEVRLRDGCKTITGDGWNETYSVKNLPFLSDELFTQYGRPVYSYVGPVCIGGECGVDGQFESFLLFSGNRWFAYARPLNTDVKAMTKYILNYHAFWYKVMTYSMVSDLTKGSTPVGVDFNIIMEQGERYGPFGNLHPLQLYVQLKKNQTGYYPGTGYYQCAG